MPAYQPTWDLDVFFPGGSRSEGFAAFLERLAADLEDLAGPVEALSRPGGGGAQAGDPRSEGRAHGSDAAAARPAGRDAWVQVLDALQDAASRLRQAFAFVSCLTAQDVHDEPARLLRGRLTQMDATYDRLLIALDGAILALPEADWTALLEDERLQPVRFTLSERRRLAAQQLPPEQETLATALAVDGYHAWGSLYDTVVGRIRIPVEEEGETKELSVGQVANRLQSPDRGVREALWPRYQEAWNQEADLCAAALNHLSGFRLNLYERRGWTSVLKEPLDANHMSEATLNAMWEAVERTKEPLLRYLKRKAELLGVDRLQWHDLSAPVGRVERRFTYDEAAAFVIEHFGRFSPELADFARNAFERRWIEAEDRPGKRPGGFCTSFPLSRQSRIFTTFSGTPDNVSTLAHELGHAYHQHVMDGLPPWAQRYPMALAETASTFAERIVTNAALRQASSPDERLALLDQKLQDAAAFFMNIHARFLFETRFYQARRGGPVSVPELNRIMEEAQREAFHDALGGYHPTFWASKLHFYLTGQPFYNFPYTFGYLFSTGVYGRAAQEGAAFAPRYVALLRDTGRMTVEELAHRHLDVDLTRPGFWGESARLAVADVEAFEEAQD
ncbi:oligoendopeptidase [Limnochorda pilosa]|uniref:Oligoendopeptidase n=1 Tax=Limnochorda pilosa TaxID=1555112 RepID=A0A0K2SHY6_LIMPI|nr:M3 family oligoendopeptidase [Limnochorda pilosa]BAS26690.1 oligoendopeptidase [Limnochorda pilosa]